MAQSCKSLVSTATQDDRNAVPGPVLRELAERTIRSFEDCQTIRDLLLKRLRHSSPDVKFKTLHSIKYIAMHGRPEFRISLQRNNQEIKDCLQYKGKYDPLRGDTPNERVRETSKEALNALFAQYPQQHVPGAAMGGAARSQALPSSRIQGFGNDPVEAPSSRSPSGGREFSPVFQMRGGEDAKQSSRDSDSAAAGRASDAELFDSQGNALKLESGAYSTGKMVGFGNTPVEPASSSSRFFQKIKSKMMNAASGSGGSGGRRHLSGFREHQHSPRFNNPAQQVSASDFYMAQATTTSPAEDVAPSFKPRARGGVGGGWDDDDKGSSLQTSSASGPSSSASPAWGGSAGSAMSAADSQTQAAEAAKRQSNGQHETRLVEKFTAPSGVRVLPKMQELREFLNVTQRLDHYTLCRCLAQIFMSPELASRVKAVTYTLALVDTGSEAAEDYLLDEPDALAHLYAQSLMDYQQTVGQPGINYHKVLVERLEKILTLIGMQEVIESSSTQAVPAAATSQETVGASSTSPQPENDPVFDVFNDPAPGVGATQGSLFDGLDAAPAASSATKKSGGADDILSLFDAPASPTGVQPDPQQGNNKSAFDFLDDGGAQSSASPSSGGIDLFASLKQSQPAAPVDSLFSQLDLDSNRNGSSTSPLDLYGSPIHGTQGQAQPAAGINFLDISSASTSPAPPASSKAFEDPFAFIDNGPAAAPSQGSSGGAFQLDGVSKKEEAAKDNSFDFVQDMLK